MDNSFQFSTIEALIMASPDPLPARKISEMVEGFTPARVAQAVASLNNRYMESGNSFRIREIAGGYQIFIVPEFAGYVQEMFSRRRKLRLTRAALETLAIIAYRQPVTRVEIEQIRGVASDGVLHNLAEKNMVTIKGRSDSVGKPLQYGTTDEFLKFFGLNSIDDLPKMSEIEELITSEGDGPEIELSLDDDDDNGNGNGNGSRTIAANVADHVHEKDQPSRLEEGPGDEETTPDDDRDPERLDGQPTSGLPEDACKDEAGGTSGIIIDIDTT